MLAMDTATWIVVGVAAFAGLCLLVVFVTWLAWSTVQALRRREGASRR